MMEAISSTASNFLGLFDGTTISLAIASVIVHIGMLVAVPSMALFRTAVEWSGPARGVRGSRAQVIVPRNPAQKEIDEVFIKKTLAQELGLSDESLRAKSDSVLKLHCNHWDYGQLAFMDNYCRRRYYALCASRVDLQPPQGQTRSITREIETDASWESFIEFLYTQRLWLVKSKGVLASTPSARELLLSCSEIIFSKSMLGSIAFVLFVYTMSTLCFQVASVLLHSVSIPCSLVSRVFGGVSRLVGGHNGGGSPRAAKPRHLAARA